MILNLWTNFEFSSLWNYHFTLYALKCKKVKLMVPKWGVNIFINFVFCNEINKNIQNRFNWLGYDFYRLNRCFLVFIGSEKISNFFRKPNRFRHRSLVQLVGTIDLVRFLKSCTQPQRLIIQSYLQSNPNSS